MALRLDEVTFWISSSVARRDEYVSQLIMLNSKVVYWADLPHPIENISSASSSPSSSESTWFAVSDDPEEGGTAELLRVGFPVMQSDWLRECIKNESVVSCYPSQTLSAQSKISRERRKSGYTPRKPPPERLLRPRQRRSRRILPPAPKPPPRSESLDPSVAFPFDELEDKIVVEIHNLKLKGNIPRALELHSLLLRHNHRTPLEVLERASELRLEGDEDA